MYQTLRQIFIGSLLSFIGVTNAAAVVIDFNEYTSIVSTFQNLDPVTPLIQGYTMTASPSEVELEGWMNSDGPPISDAGIIFGGSGGSVTFTQNEGLAFGVESLVFFAGFTGPAPFADLQVTAIHLNGSTTNHLFTMPYAATGDFLQIYEFNGALKNVTSLNLRVAGGTGFGFDDLTVTEVPVPAAVWLFASALAGLGWMRRRSV